MGSGSRQQQPSTHSMPKALCELSLQASYQFAKCGTVAGQAELPVHAVAQP